MDIKIGFILIGLAAYEQAELYIRAIENMLSNTFLSDLSRHIRNDFFHSFSSITLAIRNEGIVLPIFRRATYLGEEKLLASLFFQLGINYYHCCYCIHYDTCYYFLSLHIIMSC